MEGHKVKYTPFSTNPEVQGDTSPSTFNLQHLKGSSEANMGIP
jgi:hypothetical protein